MAWNVEAHAGTESFGRQIDMRHGSRSGVKSMELILSRSYCLTKKFRIITLVEYYMVKYLTKLS